MDRGAWWATAQRVTECQTRLKQLSMQAQSLFSTWCWDNWISTFKRMNLDSYHSPHTKNNSKWIKDLNVRVKTMNVLEEDIGEYLWPSVKQWFLKYDIKVQATCFKRHHQESKKTTHRMKKYFHVVCLIRNWYNKYIKSSYNSISLKKKKKKQLKHGQQIWKHMSLKKMCK